MKKILSIALIACMVLSCVCTGVVFADETTYSWTLLRATGFGNAEGNTAGTTWNNTGRNNYNYEIYASDDLVFANTRSGSVNHLLSSVEGDASLEVRNKPYIGDARWDYPAIHVWDKNAGTSNTDASTLFGETTGGRIRVSFDIIAYGLTGSNKVILGFDCADRVSAETNKWVETNIDNSVAINVVPKGTTITKDDYTRITAEFDYTNAKTQKGFVIEFLGDASNEDTTNFCDYEIDNFMIETGTAEASTSTKTNSIQAFHTQTLRDGEESYVGVFDTCTKNPDRYPTVGNVRCAMVNYNPNPSVSNISWGNWNAYEFSQAYNAVTNDVLSATANTGYIVADALPEFTAADIGKTYRLRTTIRPHGFNLDDDSSTNLTTTVPVKVGTITGYDYKHTNWTAVAKRYETIEGYDNIETTNVTAYETAPWDLAIASGEVYEVNYSFTVTPETLDVKGFFVEVDMLSLIKTNAETGEKYTELTNGTLAYKIGRIEVYESPAKVVELEIKPFDDGYMIYDSSANYINSNAIIAEYSGDVFRKLDVVKPNRGAAYVETDGNILKGFIWNDMNSMVPIIAPTADYTVEK